MSAISAEETKLAEATDDKANFLLSVESACQQACAHIAPAWPLDRSIAVNPHWGRIGADVRTVAARLAVLGGVQVFPPRGYIRNAWSLGRIKPDHLARALEKLGAPLTEAQCHAALQQEPTTTRLPLLIDLLEVAQDGESCFSWRNAVTHQISQTCAAYFDQHQADWRPAPDTGLYEFWRTTISHDQGIGVLMGLPDFSECLTHLPATAKQAEEWALQKFGLQPAVWADYLEALLLTVNGWASWCAYLGWQAKLEGQTSTALRDLLAIRLAWGVILLENCSAAHAPAVFQRLQTDWNRVPEAVRAANKALLMDEVWQVALEIGYQQQLLSQLTTPPNHAPVAVPNADSVKAQAIFCIDVRSERLRRAIEQVDPAIRTSGFAGFFGLPIGYAPLGSTTLRPQLPGLLAPRLTVTDELVPAHGAALPMDMAELERLRTSQHLHADQWGALSRWPGSSYSFVETFGLAFAGKLGGWLRALGKDRPRDDLEGIPMRLRPLYRPALQSTSVEQRAELCGGVLKAMGMTAQFPPLVILVGHGSQSANNPHAAGLDCGACGGQTGEVNARVLARVLNDPAVRQRLWQQGIEIPDSTTFVAALHNTTTDELEWFDTDLAVHGSPALLAEVQTSLERAQNLVRLERAPSLGVETAANASALLGLFKQRASDGAQTRPEWALAGNASFLIGPRSASQHLALAGRTFLHDYDWRTDTDGNVLELLMTAPMLVTNWINWQYHASLCEPRLYGSGNKVLHNVVGGNIGVFEGNGGDLRQGLSQQSLHDGNDYVHEPLRLTVVICAPQPRIEAIVQRHQVLQDLINNGWIHLWHLDGAQLHTLNAHGWSPA